MKLEFQPLELVEKEDEFLPGYRYQEPVQPIVPGAVLRLKDGTLHLVGTVNRILGVCDDCTEFQLEDIKEIAYIPLEGDLSPLSEIKSSE